MTACYWVAGVPLDMIHRARRQGGEAMQDLETLVAVNVQRLKMFSQSDRMASVGFAAFILTAITVCAFFYELEVAKGLFFLVVPISVAMVVNLYATMRLDGDPPKGRDLIKYLQRLRLLVQVIAMLAIFVTIIYGIFFSLNQPLGY